MKRTILYVDDEEANLRTFRSVFRRYYNILTATSGEEGLKILEEHDLDVLITDQNMPGMNGVELLKKLYERKPFLKLSRIMISGFAEAEEVKEAREKYQLQKFISKPWDSKELKETIDESIIKE